MNATLLRLLLLTLCSLASATFAMKRIDLVKRGGFAAGDHLVTTKVNTPEPKANEVIIDIKTSAINPVDWKMAEYGILMTPEGPAALGCDVAGIVVDAGTDEAAKSLVGKRVLTYLGAQKSTQPTARGAYADLVAADADVVVELPENMTFAAGVTIPVGALTAELLLNELSLPGPDAPIVIWGASSSVGHFCVQLAAKRGHMPIAIASGKHSTALMKLGAASFVDYKKDDVAGKVKEFCVGSKLNGAIDCIGMESTFATCAKLLLENGDSSAGALVVSTVSPSAILPPPPDGIKLRDVELAFALENKESRKLVQSAMPEIVNLEPQPIRLVQGPVAAETVQEAFQINKDGVSGEKVVIEWTQ